MLETPRGVHRTQCAHVGYHWRCKPSNNLVKKTLRYALAADGDIPDTPRGVDRTRCAHAGCHRRFHRLRYKDVKHALQRHYCGVCQRVVCHVHTRFTPHGPFSSCGMESQCICEDCFGCAVARHAGARRTTVV